MRKLLLFVLTLNACQNNPPVNQANVWTEFDRNLLVTELTEIRDTLLWETQSLTMDQWSFRAKPDSWCIGEVIEHLALHDALFFREIRSTSSLYPPTPLADTLLDEDHYLWDYAQITTVNSGKAPWYLDPADYWCSPEQAWSKYVITHDAYIDFIGQTDRNLRAFYSTNGRGKKPYRDLHQLTLVSIAHAKRHITQIQNIKSHHGFPDSEN